MKLIDTRKPYIRYNWGEVTNTDAPMRYSDDFSADNGYFTEEDGEKLWKIENGVLSAKADDNGALTYLHIYEKNVRMKLRFRLLEPTSGAQLQFILRYNSPEAYVSVKYLCDEQIFGLYSSEGEDFPLYKHGSAYGKSLEPGEWHELDFTVDGDRAEGLLDGEQLFSVGDIVHLSPGRVALLVKNAKMEIDRFDAEFLSGQGTLLKNTVHNKLPDEKYREGGTVIEMKDGSLTYIYGGGDTFTSNDSGATWQRADAPFTSTFGYPNMLRLRNGELMKIITARGDDGEHYKASVTSNDDGKTWTAGGNICRTHYEFNDDGAVGGAINMNDKVTQISSGRIFYCQNYSFGGPTGPLYKKHSVLCEFFYSDDEGKTWKKSKTASYQLPGNENEKYFGECKILECSDGTLRIYNSWNNYGCIVYSESTDGGETFGEIKKLPELVCARSSMQFYRDPYAENDTTYYMVWVYSKPCELNEAMCRSRLCLARSTDGKNWSFLGDIWRWEARHYKCSHLAHIVDPFVMTTRDSIICGSGITEKSEVPEAGDHPFHHAQRQHIWSIKKSTITETTIRKV